MTAFHLSSFATEPVVVNVAVAANARPAMEEIASAVLAETGVKSNIISGSSGQISAQIMAGASYDLFFAADVNYAQKTFEAGYSSAPPVIYAVGSLVLWSNDGTDVSDGVKSLLSPSVRKIAVGNPYLAPYGRVAVAAMKKEGVYDKVKGRLVFGESVSQASQMVFSKAVSAGFTSKSVVLSPQMAGVGKWVEIPGAEEIGQGAVVLKHASGNTGAEKFFQYVLSPAGKKILQKYGYKTP
ncbi:MAG: molybdate ABC transporter substrate-binding protein [Nitrospinae bacterium]|nr:molybdate ABC transporter substrate-binding protein [Nitrospinota bacterium]